jgi:hypothetical protein
MREPTKAILHKTKLATFIFMQCCFDWFPDEDPLGLETCRNILCDIITEIYKAEHCAFC